MKKIFIFLMTFIAGGFFLVSCSDWTDDESVDITQPTNPAYENYLANLRSYKASNHKMVYAWFDNSEKTPYSRGQHISDIPDSVDVVAVMYPENLVDFEITDIKTLQNDKGTKVVCPISYDAIKKTYEQMVKDNTIEDPNYTAPVFTTYLKDVVQNLLNSVALYNYDGIIYGFNGMSTIYMNDQDKAEYLANENAFISQISSWYNSNKEKILVFQGNPQLLTDKSMLQSCKNIILNTLSVDNATELSVHATEALADGVPTDRFIVIASTISLDTSDRRTGYYGTDRAIIEAAYWVTQTESRYTKAGLGIYDIQNDYYNVTQVYQYAKEAINIMNPAPVN